MHINPTPPRPMTWGRGDDQTTRILDSKLASRAADGEAMRLIYVAHPFGGNQHFADNAEELTALLNLRVERAVFICPWLPMVRCWVNSGEHRARGLMLDCETVKLCHGLLLLGKEHSMGMLKEFEAATAAGIPSLKVSNGWLMSEAIAIQEWVDSMPSTRLPPAASRSTNG